MNHLHKHQNHFTSKERRLCFLIGGSGQSVESIIVAAEIAAIQEAAEKGEDVDAKVEQASETYERVKDKLTPIERKLIYQNLEELQQRQSTNVELAELKERMGQDVKEEEEPTPGPAPTPTPAPSAAPTEAQNKGEKKEEKEEKGLKDTALDMAESVGNFFLPTRKLKENTSERAKQIIGVLATLGIVFAIAGAIKSKSKIAKFGLLGGIAAMFGLGAYGKYGDILDAKKKAEEAAEAAKKKADETASGAADAAKRLKDSIVGETPEEREQKEKQFFYRQIAPRMMPFYGDFSDSDEVPEDMQFNVYEASSRKAFRVVLEGMDGIKMSELSEITDSDRGELTPEAASKLLDRIVADGKVSISSMNAEKQKEYQKMCFFALNIYRHHLPELKEIFDVLKTSDKASKLPAQKFEDLTFGDSLKLLSLHTRAQIGDFADNITSMMVNRTIDPAKMGTALDSIFKKGEEKADEVVASEIATLLKRVDADKRKDVRLDFVREVLSQLSIQNLVSAEDMIIDNEFPDKDGKMHKLNEAEQELFQSVLMDIHGNIFDKDNLIMKQACGGKDYIIKALEKIYNKEDVDFSDALQLFYAYEKGNIIFIRIKVLHLLKQDDDDTTIFARAATDLTIGGAANVIGDAVRYAAGADVELSPEQKKYYRMLNRSIKNKGKKTAGGWWGVLTSDTAITGYKWGGGIIGGDAVLYNLQAPKFAWGRAWHEPITKMQNRLNTLGSGKLAKVRGLAPSKWAKETHRIISSAKAMSTEMEYMQNAIRNLKEPAKSNVSKTINKFFREGKFDKWDDFLRSVKAAGGNPAIEVHLLKLKEGTKVLDLARNKLIARMARGAKNIKLSGAASKVGDVIRGGSRAASVLRNSRAVKSSAEAMSKLSSKAAARAAKIAKLIKLGKVARWGGPVAGGGLVAVEGYLFFSAIKPALEEQIKQEKDPMKRARLERELNSNYWKMGGNALGTVVMCAPGPGWVAGGIIIGATEGADALRSSIEDSTRYILQDESDLIDHSPGAILHEIGSSRSGKYKSAGQAVASSPSKLIGAVNPAAGALSLLAGDKNPGDMKESFLTANETARQEAYFAYFARSAAVQCPPMDIMHVDEYTLDRADKCDSKTEATKILEERIKIMNRDQIRLYVSTAARYIEKRTNRTYDLTYPGVLRRAESFARLRIAEWQKVRIDPDSAEEFPQANEKKAEEMISEELRERNKMIQSDLKSLAEEYPEHFKANAAAYLLEEMSHELAVCERKMFTTDWSNIWHRGDNEDFEYTARGIYAERIQDVLKQLDPKKWKDSSFSQFKTKILKATRGNPDAMAKDALAKGIDNRYQKVGIDKAALTVPNLIAGVR